MANTAFPIFCMAPTSLLQIYATMAGPMCRFLNAAALSKDPVTRMQFVMAASVCFLVPMHSWGKPLNPILGETF